MEYISECCGAIPFDDTLDLNCVLISDVEANEFIGRCNQCKEMSVFTEEE